MANPYAGKVPGTFGGATITRSGPYARILIWARLQFRLHMPAIQSITPFWYPEEAFLKGFSILASHTFAKLVSDSIYNGLNFIGSEGGNEFGYQNGLYNRRAERAEIHQMFRPD